MNLGQVGVWAGGPWRDRSRRAEARETARLVESLGFGALWMSAGFQLSLDESFRPLLEATETIPIASGIASVWHTSPEEATETYNRFEGEFPGRFVLGLGASHERIVNDTGQHYERPYSRVVSYLDALDQAPHPVPGERRILAALGPRMLTLAKERTAGAHPYFVPVENTSAARAVLGKGPLLCTEQAVVVEEDPERARQIARPHLAIYLTLPNYTDHLRRLGFSDADLEPPGSDATIDRLVGWGSATRIAERVRAHLDAGADHVCVQVLTESDQFPHEEYRKLAAALL